VGQAVGEQAVGEEVRRDLCRSALALLRRPGLWPIALIEARLFVPERWWSAWPPLPLPAREWLAFRMETAYGDPSAHARAEDLIAWLEWCRAARRAALPPVERHGA